MYVGRTGQYLLAYQCLAPRGSDEMDRKGRMTNWITVQQIVSDVTPAPAANPADDGKELMLSLAALPLCLDV